MPDSDFITQDGTLPLLERDTPTRTGFIQSSPSIVPDAPIDDRPWLQVLHPVEELRRLDLLDPDPRCINFHEMAKVLSRIPRFAGQTKGGAYTVAQHSVEGCDGILRDTGNRLAAAAFLMHDAHEYVIGDLATPILQGIMAHANAITGNPHAGDVVKQSVSSLKHRLDTAIHEAAGLPWPLTPDIRSIVKEYDARMCQSERLVRLERSPGPWPMYDDLVPVEGCDLFFFEPGTIASLFAQKCRDLLPALGGDAGI